MQPERTVAGFDSATTMLQALSLYLQGHDVPLTGEGSHQLERAILPVMQAANRWPRTVKERIYAVTGWKEAVSARNVDRVDSGALARWVTGQYPQQETNVAFVGSTNGALTHLAAAVAGPWLPQTLLVPVRRFGVPPEDGRKDLMQMRSAGRRLLTANPDWSLHHMHDPNQDRLMVAGMCYFRLKWRRLPEAYREHLRATLAPGGTLVVSDCQLRWPTTHVDERYTFQHGGLGGATHAELAEGGERVRRYLSSYGSRYSTWVGPVPDTESPEAEWGFEPELLEDLRTLAQREGWRLVRLSYAEPETLSPAVADLYREWYTRRGIPVRRLLVESFMLVEPYWALRTGSVPFWMVFNKETSLAALKEYLDATASYPEIRLTLFSHGVESVGLAYPEQWRSVFDYAGESGDFLGVDPSVFPRDFAVFARTHQEMTQLRPKHVMPHALDWAQAEEFLAARDEITLHTEHEPA